MRRHHPAGIGTMGGGAAAAVTMQMVEEVHIDWTAETAGAIGASYVDTVTGVTWTKTTSGTLGTMAATIAASGLDMAGTAGGAAWVKLRANLGDLIDAVTTGAAYDGTIDTVEIVHVCDAVAMGTGTEVIFDLVGADGRLFRVGGLDAASVDKTRVIMDDYVGTGLSDQAATVTAAVWAMRVSGATARIRWANSAASSAWADLAAPASREVWSMRGGPSTGDMDSADDFDWTVGLEVVGQNGVAVQMRVTDTYIRRWRGVAS